jgi:predicted TIM-barrel fold metal-dependent hydrolase
MIIDVHHHWIPAEHIKNIRKYLLPGQTLEKKGESLVVKEGPWELFNPRPLFCMTDEQIHHLDDAGIDMTVLSMGCYQDWNNMAVAPQINDAMAEVQSKYPRRIIGLAHVPPLDQAAPRELERAVKELGLKGLSFNTNTRGVYPDAREFAPLYRKAAELDVPIVIHAASMPYTEYMRQVTWKGMATPLLARSIDHMIATTRVVASGVLEEFPTLKFIFGHLGGSGFFTSMARFGFRADTAAYRRIRAQLFFDTAPVGWDKAALNCAISAYGVGNVLMGSDYPAVVSDGPGLKRAITAISELGLAPQDQAKVLGRNAAALFKIA